MQHTTIRIPPDFLRQLRERAKRNERTVSGEIRMALKAYLGEGEGRETVGEKEKRHAS